MNGGDSGQDRPTPSVPGRVVDCDNRGWYLTADLDGNFVYAAGRDSETYDYQALSDAHGPLRPVCPITAADQARLDELLAAAGRKAVATVAAALELVYYRCRKENGWLTHAAESAEFAKRTLTAGRAGSWESAALFQLVLFGNGLNLVEGEGSVDECRAAGPNRRVDGAVRDQIADIVDRWVRDPDRYTEVADTLAGVVSAYCDNAFGADGWNMVADQWLRPKSLDREGFESTYGLLYSQSRHFNAMQ